MSLDRPMTDDEALKAEVLKELFGILPRLEAIDKALADKIRKSTEEAGEKAFTAAHFRHENMLDNWQKRFIATADKAGDSIASTLDAKITSMTTVSKSMYRNCWSLLITIAATSILSGFISGVIVHYIK